MTDAPRILTIMGSGETAPTMKAPHRAIFERLGADVDAVLLDTPFGFQENAPILASKAIEYFRDAVGRKVDAAGLTRMDSGDTVAIERGVARVRGADWVFAGPGSPTYSLAQWVGTPIPAALVDKVRSGGAIVFSSAAALTIGTSTVPVYEIYKVGVEPHWLDGLAVLNEVGLDVAVIPHFDNAEGGNHDTRFCYLGERRLAMLEAMLPDECFVFGIDEHTGVVMDLDADIAEIVGKGAVTLRHHGNSVRIESGRTVPIDLLRAGPPQVTGARAPGSDLGLSHVTDAHAPGSDLGLSHLTDAHAPGSDLGLTPGQSVSGNGKGALSDATQEGAIPPEGLEPDSLASAAKLREATFTAAIAARDADAAVAAILELEADIVEWSRDTLQSDDVDRARAALRSMIVRLGAAATDGVRDRRDVLGPVVEAALAARLVARSEKAFAVSDAIRDELAGAGIEVRDTADGTEWLIVDD
jgi:cyanophycinase-like exopeptidase